MNKRLLWTMSGILIGVCITFATNYAVCGLKGFKTPLEKKDTLVKYSLKQEYKNAVVTKDTVKSNAERITRLERYIFKKGK